MKMYKYHMQIEGIHFRDPQAKVSIEIEKNLLLSKVEKEHPNSYIHTSGFLVRSDADIWDLDFYVYKED